jgi:hypothetical protein
MAIARAGPPPPLYVDDDAPIRHDVDSDDVRRVHPDLPSTAQGRLEHLRRCDDLAFASVCERFPELCPPAHRLVGTTSISTTGTTATGGATAP